jgi:hypothetical protein
MIDRRAGLGASFRGSHRRAVMDRRQLLLAMTAVGLAGQFNLSGRLNAQDIDDANQEPRAKRVYPPDVELNVPRGPIRRCVEETSAPDGSVRTHIYEYSPDGRMVSARSEQNGQPTFSTDNYVHTEVRDAEGRLLKFVSGARGEPGRETYNRLENRVPHAGFPKGSTR